LRKSDVEQGKQTDMKKTFALLVAAISLSAHASTMESVGAACPYNGAQGFSGSSAAAHRVACVEHNWVDVASLKNVSVRFEAFASSASGVPSHLFIDHQGFVGIPSVTSVSEQSDYVAATTPSEVKTANISTGVTLQATVVSINADHTAHVVLDIDAVKVTGGGHDHADVSVPVGVKTVVATDDAGIEYSITVDELAPQKEIG
jgi:hypothetical protein